MKKGIKKVVIPVAGLGTRGLPFTKEVPKELLPIIDTPTIHFIVEEVIAAGIEQVIFVTSKGKEQLEDYFDPSPNLEAWLRKRGKEALADKVQRIGMMCEVMSVRQKEPLGLGHAILCARNIVGNEMFAVCLGDEIFPDWDSTRKKSALRQLVDTAEEVSASVVGTVEIPREDSTSYGILDLGGRSLGAGPSKILRTVEKPKPDAAPSNYAIIGRYVFEPTLFDYLKEVKPGVGGEIQLTDGMDRLCQGGKVYALKIDGIRYDIGNHFSYVKAQLDAALRGRSSPINSDRTYALYEIPRAHFIFGAFLTHRPGVYSASLVNFHDVFEGRRPGESWETVIHHRVEIKPGESFVFDERILNEKGREFFIWSGPGFPRAVGAARDGQGYALAPGKNLPSRSHAVVRYLTGGSADEMRDTLLAEQFVRKDQFLEFEAGFTPEGDPQTWNLREKYLRHPDIYLQRLGANVAILVAGVEDAAHKRAVFFDRGLRGMRRLEWRDGAQSEAWNMEGFGAGAKASVPHRASFEINGVQTVTSDIVSAHGIRQTQDFRTAWRQAAHDGALSGNQEAALRLVLSYR